LRRSGVRNGDAGRRPQEYRSPHQGSFPGSVGILAKDNCNDDEKTVACFDFLIPRVGGLIDRPQREHRLDKLLVRMKECGMSPGKYGWHTYLGRFGTVPHGGFGPGFERMLMFATGMANIRDIRLCPRVPGNASF
jgi:asparaginyl-tRNA synthetase